MLKLPVLIISNFENFPFLFQSSILQQISDFYEMKASTYDIPNCSNYDYHINQKAYWKNDNCIQTMSHFSNTVFNKSAATDKQKKNMFVEVKTSSVHSQLEGRCRHVIIFLLNN